MPEGHCYHRLTQLAEHHSANRPDAMPLGKPPAVRKQP
jgi:hypothetical protein